MCGILGYSDRNPVTLAMTSSLAIGMASRGRDSWGVTNGYEVHKEARCILDGYVDLELPGPQTFHTRGASVGSVTEANAHPFTHTAPSGLRVTGVHNGHIHNWADLNFKYSRNFSVDSQHIFAHLAERRDLGEIDGWGTIVWWEHHPGEPAPRGPFFSGWRNMNLAMCRLSTGDLVWASTKEPILVGARFAGVEVTKTYDLQPKKKYGITRHPGGGWGLFSVKGVLAWAERPFTRSSQGRSAGASYKPGGTGWLSNLCKVLRCHRPLQKEEHVVCAGCLKEVQTKLGILNVPKHQEVIPASHDTDDDLSEWGWDGILARQLRDAY